MVRFDSCYEDMQPLYIECETADFRQDLDTCIALRKRLAIDQKYLIIYVADLL